MVISSALISTRCLRSFTRRPKRPLGEGALRWIGSNSPSMMLDNSASFCLETSSLRKGLGKVGAILRLPALVVLARE
ncbi:Uncharacterised protein [Vibrio cholerae]|nr:Uncharacterised protein [Vibrio cholerae]